MQFLASLVAIASTEFANRIWTKMTVLYISHDSTVGAYKCPWPSPVASNF